MTVSAEGRVENQKLNQTAALSFWFSTRFTRKTLDHSVGSYLYNVNRRFGAKCIFLKREKKNNGEIKKNNLQERKGETGEKNENNKK